MLTRKYYPRKAAYKNQIVWSSIRDYDNRLRIVPMKIVAVDDWADIRKAKPKERHHYQVYYWCTPRQEKDIEFLPKGHALALGLEIFLTKREAYQDSFNWFEHRQEKSLSYF